MKLVIARSALHDLQDIKNYYAEQRVPEVGLRLVGDVLKQVQRLPAHPDSGRMVPEFEQRHIRELVLPPFRIVYLREASRISLIRVWRSERLLVLP